MRYSTIVLCVAMISTSLAGCATKDCSGYDPAKDDDLFKASGGLASKCYQKIVDEKKRRLHDERMAADERAAESAELEERLRESRAKNDALRQRVDVAREELRQVESELNALKNDADPTARKAAIEKKLKQIEREIEALRKADTKAERDKAEYQTRRKELELEFERLHKVTRAFAK